MNWLVVVCALVVLCEFCVDLVKELVGCCVCFGCLLLILCGFCVGTCWLWCVLLLSFVIFVWMWRKHWLVVVCALVVLCEFCVDLVKELVGCCVCFGCLLLILC